MTTNSSGHKPSNYTTPAFPALYWPVSALPGEPQYIYDVADAWRFTLFWTIIIFEAFHLAASGYACAVQWKNWKIMWMVLLLYMAVSGVEALLAGSVVGLMCDFSKTSLRRP